MKFDNDFSNWNLLQWVLRIDNRVTLKIEDQVFHQTIYRLHYILRHSYYRTMQILCKSGVRIVWPRKPI